MWRTDSIYTWTTMTASKRQSMAEPMVRVAHYNCTAGGGKDGCRTAKLTTHGWQYANDTLILAVASTAP